MAAIGKIRQRSGLLIIIVGVALAAFVLGDLFKNMRQGKQKYDPTVVAYINGEKIGSRDFSERIDEGASNMMRNSNKTDLTSEERYSVQIQMWDQVKDETLLRQQCEELGLIQDNGVDPLPGLSMEEYAGMLTGPNPHPFIEQNFKGQDGKFDPTLVTRFLNGVEAGKNSDNPKDVEQAEKSENEWNMLEKYMKSDRISTKYFNLISKAYFVSKTIAREKYFEQNDSRSVRFVGVRYGLINDTLVEPTDEDYNAYYEEHKNEFKSKEETRNIDYIVWNVTPSEEDMLDLQKSVNEMYQEMIALPVSELPSFVNRNSDKPYDSSWVTKGNLSPFIDSMAFSSEIGVVFSPWRENNMFHMGRLIDRQLRPDSMRASHILIAYSGAFRADEKTTRTKITASALADSLLEVVKKDPNRFGELAVQYSNDPTAAQKEGDLDWFADGAMVPEFNTACINGKVGDIVKVETSFGFHLIKITGKKEPEPKVRVALIDIPIMFSQKTYEKVFNDASQFVSRARDAASFDSVSINMGLSVAQSNDLTKMSNGVLGVPDSRKVVQWLYNENTELGAVSDVFDFTDKVMVALYKHDTPKGVKPLDDELKEFIKVLVIRDLKAKKLSDEYANVKDLADAASRSNSKIDTMDFMTFSAYSLKGYGPEPTVQGTMLASPLKQMVGPVKGDQGVYFFIVDAENKAQEPKDGYRFIATQEEAQFGQGLRKDYNNSNAALKAVVDKADIEDYRQYFY